MQALAECKRQKKPLLIYLHSHYHTDTPAFCSNVFGSAAVADFVDANFLCWVGPVSSTEGLEASIWCQV